MWLVSCCVNVESRAVNYATYFPAKHLYMHREVYKNTSKNRAEHAVLKARRLRSATS